jgi:hypothetical protein
MARPLLAVAAATLITMMAGMAAAQQAPMPTNNPQAQANVRGSKQYSAVIRSNAAFRRRRMQIECGPITDPQLHQECIESFQAYK